MRKKNIDIIYKNISEVIPYKNNPRNNDLAVEPLMKSIKEYGFKVPLVIDVNGVIITGHTRLKAAKKLKLKQVPCVIASDLTDEQIKAFRIADNKVSEFAEWDDDLLSFELEALDDELFTGFEDINFSEAEETKEDNFNEEPPINPVSKRGDIWTLGNHRLMCGDSTGKDDVEMLVDGNHIDLIQTDPPYGMNAVSKSGVLSKTYKTDIIGDDNNEIAINAFKLCQELFPTAAQVWWGANYYTECIPSSECWVVWDKNNGESDQTDCEIAWTNFRSVVRQFTLSSEKINRVHPTQKPVKLVAWIIHKFDKNNAYHNILDLFGGSGFTLIGAEQLNRSSYLMELDEKYVDVIVKRYVAFMDSTDNIKVLRDGKEYSYDDIFINND